MSSSPTEQPGAHPGTDPAAPGVADEEAAGGDVTQILMPQMGVSVAEGTILEWRKRPGDWVEADEPVCDVTTDKVDVEIPSPASGRLERILVKPGTTVAVGTLLAEIDAAARPGEAHPAEHHEAKAGRSQPATALPAAGVQRPAARTEPAPEAANGETDRSRFHSPVVRRIAGKHRVDLSQVQGTGIGGRVRKKDVLAYVQAQEGAPRQAAPEPVLHTESPYQGEEAQAPAASEVAAAGSAAGTPSPRPVEELAPGRREPMSPMRQAIARHMVGSRRTAAHCTTIVEADFSRVGARRRRASRADAAPRRQPHLSGVRGPGHRGGAPGAPATQRLGGWGRDRLLRRRQPRDRGGLGGRADRSGDPPGAAPQPGGHGGRHRRPRRARPDEAPRAR